MAANRLDRINAELERALQGIIARELKDPGILGMVSVMRCSVTNDLRQAKVLVSVFADDAGKRKGTLEALSRSAGFIRHRLGEEVDLRYVPELHFELDTSLDNSIRINQLLNQLHKEDK